MRRWMCLVDEPNSAHLVLFLTLTLTVRVVTILITNFGVNRAKDLWIKDLGASDDFLSLSQIHQPSPKIINTNPRRRRFSSGISMTFRIQSFIFAGKAKYGTPSKIMTMPTTHRKNSIQFPFSAGAPGKDSQTISVKGLPIRPHLTVVKGKGGFGSRHPPKDRRRRDDACRYHGPSGVKEFMAA